MVDWNLDAESPVIREQSLRRNQPKKPIKKSGPLGVRKSKPLVSNTNQHLHHSGKKRPKQQTVAVRRVKRDSVGNIVSSRSILFSKTTQCTNYTPQSL